MAAENELMCPVCREAPPSSGAEKSGAVITQLACGHAICTPCLGDFVASAISSAQVLPENLSCPWPTCRLEICEEQLLDALRVCPNGVRLMERLQDLRAQAFALSGTARSRPAQCPTPGCAIVLVPTVTGDARCPHCNIFFCTRCGEKVHPTLSCAERAACMDELLEHKGFSRCPKCRLGVELVGGCKFLTCPQCRTFFCHLCGEGLSKADHYSHYEGFPGQEGPYGNTCRHLFARQRRDTTPLRPRERPRAGTPRGRLAEVGKAAGRSQQEQPRPASLPPRNGWPPAVAQPAPPKIPVPPPPVVKAVGTGWQIRWAAGHPQLPVQDVHVELRCVELELRSILEVVHGEIDSVYVPQSAFNKGTWEVRVAFRPRGSVWGKLSLAVVLPKARAHTPPKAPSPLVHPRPHVPPLPLPLQQPLSPPLAPRRQLCAPNPRPHVPLLPLPLPEPLSPPSAPRQLMQNLPPRRPSDSPSPAPPRLNAPRASSSAGSSPQGQRTPSAPTHHRPASSTRTGSTRTGSSSARQASSSVRTGSSSGSARPVSQEARRLHTPSRRLSARAAMADLSRFAPPSRPGNLNSMGHSRSSPANMPGHRGRPPVQLRNPRPQQSEKNISLKNATSGNC